MIWNWFVISVLLSLEPMSTQPTPPVMPVTADMKLLVKGIGQLVTVAEGATFLAGADMANIRVREGCLAVAVDGEGNIAMVGDQEEVGGTEQQRTV